jgi:serine/threonine protein kinase
LLLDTESTSFVECNSDIALKQNCRSDGLKALVTKILAAMASSTHQPHGANAHSANVVGVHYRVGKKIGEGSFGVIFEGQNLLNNQPVAIKFVHFLTLHLSSSEVVG